MTISTFLPGNVPLSLHPAPGEGGGGGRGRSSGGE